MHTFNTKTALSLTLLLGRYGLSGFYNSTIEIPIMSFDTCEDRIWKVGASPGCSVDWGGGEVETVSHAGSGLGTLGSWDSLHDHSKATIAKSLPFCVTFSLLIPNLHIEDKKYKPKVNKTRSVPTKGTGNKQSCGFLTKP